MREFKFRCWDNISKEMRYFDLMTIHSYSHPTHWYKSTKIIHGIDDKIRYPNNPMLFTGFHDENKQEIYGDDIVRFWDDSMKKNRDERVFFENGAFWVYGREGQRNWGKIIGNIYENPELLKEQK